MQHVLIEAHGCRRLEPENVTGVCDAICKEFKLTVLKKISHTFTKRDEGAAAGATACCLLSESHLTCHSWPEEKGKACLDLFTCGPRLDPAAVAALINVELDAERVVTRELVRG